MMPLNAQSTWMQPARRLHVELANSNAVRLGKKVDLVPEEMKISVMKKVPIKWPESSLRAGLL
jgi:hypothetical protein